MATEDEARAQACKFVDDNCHSGPSLAFDAKSFRALLAIELRAAERRGAERMRDSAAGLIAAQGHAERSADDTMQGDINALPWEQAADRIRALPLPGGDGGE
jgi:hypothetical protein